MFIFALLSAPPKPRLYPCSEKVLDSTANMIPAPGCGHLWRKAWMIDSPLSVLFTAVLSRSRSALSPVSYTHLRAHETDSYLVCRLLLAKKKKNKKHQHIQPHI